MRILFIGDIVGKNGRKTVKELLPRIKKKYNIDFTIANGENATHGKGLIENHYRYLIDAGVDVITLGNHWDSKSEITDYIEGTSYLIRPLNLRNCEVGEGSKVFYWNDLAIRVTNLLGSAFMKEDVDNPYESLKRIMEEDEPCDIHIVDFHAEATGEKQSLALLMDGKITALLGTHTHVQTRDARILPQKTAYISDVGMCGPYNGVLGCNKDSVINTLWLNKKEPFTVDDNDVPLFSAVIIDVDDNSGLSDRITPLYIIDNHI